jgi:hypothetical protein
MQRSIQQLLIILLNEMPLTITPPLAIERKEQDPSYLMASTKKLHMVQLP